MANNTLYQVTGPSFSAGLVVNLSGLIIRAAPILLVWEGRHIKDVMDWIHRSPPGRYHLRCVGPDPYQTLTPGQAIFSARSRPSAPGSTAAALQRPRPPADRNAKPRPT